MIPISSRIEKYQNIYDYNIEKNGRCDIIHFDSVLGRQTAFVIQKMFPVTQKYIVEKYIDSYQNEVRVRKKSEKEIIEKAKRTLLLYKKQIPVITPDINFILEMLPEEEQE